MQWLSYYHIMQTRNRFYNAHETSAVESFSVALLCGDLEFKASSFVYMDAFTNGTVDVLRRHLDRQQSPTVLRPRLETNARIQEIQHSGPRDHYRDSAQPTEDAFTSTTRVDGCMATDILQQGCKGS